MKKYPEYKDIEYNTLDSIPNNWKFVGLTKYLESIVDYRGKTPEKVVDGVFLITARNIRNGKIDYNISKEYVKKEEFNEIMKRGVAHLGDVLLTMEAPLGEVANVDNERIALAQRIIKFRSNKKYLNNLYLKYWILTHEFQSVLQSLATGSTALGLKASKLNFLRLLLPSLPEQEKIASFLNQKTTLIDTLIIKKEKQIELLKEQRTALINHTVTKGLNPKVKMKDSGIEWLGKIPEHWEIKPLRYLGECQNGISAGAEYFGKGFPFVSYGDVYKNIVLPNEVRGLADSTEKDRLNCSVKRGDVFFTRTSETIEEIGIASTCLETIKNAVFAGFLIRFRPQQGYIKSELSKYYFRANIHRYFLVKEMNLVTRASLSQDLLKKLPVILPPNKEQIEIAEYLDDLVGKNDESIIKNQKQIGLLKEYRTTLISEAVTGKIDVRNWKPKQEN